MSAYRASLKYMASEAETRVQDRLCQTKPDYASPKVADRGVGLGGVLADRLKTVCGLPVPKQAELASNELIVINLSRERLVE